VVNVYVDVQNSRVVPGTKSGRAAERHGKNTAGVTQRGVVLLQKLQDTDDDVVDVAEPRRLQTRRKHLSLSLLKT